MCDLILLAYQGGKSSQKCKYHSTPYFVCPLFHDESSYSFIVRDYRFKIFYSKGHIEHPAHFKQYGEITHKEYDVKRHSGTIEIRSSF